MLRRLLAVTTAAALAVTGMAAAPTAAPAAAAGAVQLPTGEVVPVEHLDEVRAVFDGINDYRQAQVPPLPRLRFAPDLFALAQSWSDQMAATGSFVHRQEHWTLYPPGLTGGGEIIAARTGDDAAGLVRQWIDSPPHRSMMLGPRHSVMGVGIAFGRYLYGTTNFGTTPEGSTAPTFASIDDWLASGGEVSRDDVVGALRDVGASAPDTIRVSGWAFDFTRRDLASSVTVTVDGNRSVTVDASGRLWPWGAGEWREGHDFEASIAGAPGAVHRVCVRAEDSFGTGQAESLGCRTVEMPIEAARLAGANRYETAVEVSRAYNDPAAVDTVYLATGERYPDALALAPAAAQEGGALLLTPQSALLGVVADELQRLTPDAVVIVGAEDSVSAEVEALVAAALPGATLERLAGANRYETAVLIAREVFPDATTAYVASGRLFPDALSAAPVAAAADAPVLLTPAGSLPESVRAYLEESGIASTVVAGGEPSVSAEVAAQLREVVGAAPERIAGSDRYETNRLLAASAGVAGSPNVLLASGQNFPDALAGAAIAAGAGPLLLAGRLCVPDGTVAMIREQYRPEQLVVLGGEPTLSAASAALTRCG